MIWRSGRTSRPAPSPPATQSAYRSDNPYPPPVGGDAPKRAAEQRRERTPLPSQLTPRCYSWQTGLSATETAEIDPQALPRISCSHRGDLPASSLPKAASEESDVMALKRRDSSLHADPRQPMGAWSKLTWRQMFLSRLAAAPVSQLPPAAPGLVKCQ